ncbi:autotransporter assembly complex protein TamA [Bartonella sp. A05]|uniref:autotransporter assembly complex protein TamA n=1 Tax=Bartonella sp. A05 TaxID=2967261 RepID=UPI0022A9174E|nr:autotransporter assembly complex family protein [Bartonella sp. A05]MCZ2203478.1 autotransporter assembly complex protein TamA [Bartonella sp. A05]
MICHTRVSLKSGILPKVFVSLCFIFAFSQPLAAFELFGIRFWDGKKSNSSPYNVSDTAKSYKVEVVARPGASSVGVKIVKDVSALVADKDKVLPNSSSLLAKARSDYQAILSALHADGRYGGVISIKVNGVEVADLNPMTQLPAQSHIVILIDAGPQYVFSSARINKAALHTKDKTGKMVSIEDLDYQIGAVAKSDTILKAERWAIEGWRQQGYAKASIIGRDIVADHAAHLIDTQITINPDRKTYYGFLNVRNVSEKPRMDLAYIEWMTGLKPGQEYNPDILIKANDRLARLNVFRAVNIQEADTINPDGRLPLTLVLEERKPQRFGIGGGYSTLDGAGLEAYFIHRNLFGHAESLKIETKISGVRSKRVQLRTIFIKPGIITPDTDFRAQLQMQQDILDNYATTVFGGKWGITHIFNDNLSGNVSAFITNGYSHDDYFGSRYFTAMGLLGGLTYDSRDNKLDATKGLYGEAVLAPFYELRFDNFMTKITMEGRSYWSFDAKDRFVFATRAKLGAVIGADAAQLSSNMLFWAGGGGSVRGYAYRNIGIRKENDVVIGGKALVEGSAEVRFALNDRIAFVSFIDGGLVAEKMRFDPSEIKWGAGIGGRYVTGLGPLRFDLAFPLKREEGDPRFGFYVGIGQAF